MKKLFSIFFVLALMWSGNVCGATYNLTFKWKDGATSLGHMSNYKFLEWYYNSRNYYEEANNYDVKQLTFNQGYAANGNNVNLNNPAITLYLTWNCNVFYTDFGSNSSSLGTKNYGSITLPNPATYNVTTNSSNCYYPQVVDYGTLTAYTVNNSWACAGLTYNAFRDEAKTTWFCQQNSLNSKVWYKSVNNGSSTFTGGSVTMTEGVHGYPTITGTLNTADGNTINLTIDAKYVYNIVVNSNNNTLGTASTNKVSVTEGGSVTLTANEISGTFQGWSLDGGTTIIAGTNNQLIYSPTLGADAGSDGQTFTYTAVFVPASTPQYTISTVVSPVAAGTVEGAGDYYENTNATLTATSANEHLYFFDHWLKDGNNYAGGATITPTVTANATYTAVFRNANAGTITGVAANGTISGTGYYAGGTPVELTVTPNDGYIFTQWSDGNTDNPRTVYVDGDATYTAQFEEGVEIVIADGTCNDESGYFNFIGSANGYSVRIESASVALRTGDFSYSQLEQTSDYTYVKLNNNNIELDYSRQRANVSFWSHTHLLLEAWEYDTSGKEYHIYIKAPLPNSNEINSANSAYDVQSFPSVDNVTAADEDGKAWIYANKGGNPGTGYYVYNTWLAFMPDNTKYGKVPTGIYPIKGTEEAETAVGGYNVQIDGNGYLSSMDGCVAQRRNGYVENIWIPVDGTIEVVNVDEQYWVNVQGKSSYKQNVYFTIGTAPFNVNITSAGNGSVDILLNATNWGTTVHYDEGTSKFFSGNSITLTATPNSGYEFWRWSDEDASVKTSAYGASRNVTVSGNLTLQAIFRVAGPATITLCENCDNDHYDDFKTDYDGETVNVTYNRQFTSGRWSTMCLPFSLDLATMIANKMYGRVYEFKYATGNANVGSGVNLYFSNAKSIEAGNCYIVNANSALAEKTSFVFSGVTIDLSKDNGADLSSPATPEASVAAYNALPGYKSEGTIELVGTLRNGILMGTATGNKYMGLKENKIYYPNTDTGSTIWAYRGIFRSSSELNVEKMRIVVDGEDRGEIRIDNGELIIDNGSPVRKFIRNGNLYIEREGVIYDAQGKRVE